MSKIEIASQDSLQITEFALSLRNLSFLLSTIIEDNAAWDRDNLTAS